MKDGTVKTHNFSFERTGSLLDFGRHSDLALRPFRFTTLLIMPCLKSVAVLFMLASMPALAQTNPPRAALPEPSNDFRGCYTESKRAWLVDVVAGPGASSDRIDTLVNDLVRGSKDDVVRARTYLLDRRKGRYPTSEHMAGTMFVDCLGRFPAERPEFDKTVGCYKEQRVILHAMDMRLEQGLSMEETTGRFLGSNAGANEAVQAALRRLVRDTYVILQPGAENAFAEAQFQMCMTVYR